MVKRKPKWKIIFSPKVLENKRIQLYIFLNVFGNQKWACKVKGDDVLRSYLRIKPCRVTAASSSTNFALTGQRSNSFLFSDNAVKLE